MKTKQTRNEKIQASGVHCHHKNILIKGFFTKLIFFVVAIKHGTWNTFHNQAKILARIIFSFDVIIWFLDLPIFITWYYSLEEMQDRKKNPIWLKFRKSFNFQQLFLLQESSFHVKEKQRRSRFSSYRIKKDASTN